MTKTSSKRTHSFTGRNDSPNELGKHSAKCYTKRVLQPSRPPPPPPLILLHTIFDRKGSPFVYLLLTNDTPSNCRKCTIFLQIVNKSLNQEVFVTLLQQQNASVIYPFWFSVLFNRFFLEKSLPIRTWSLSKKLFFSSGSHGTSPYRPLQVEHSSPPVYLKVWIRHCNVQYKPSQVLGFRVQGFMPLLLFCNSSSNIIRGLSFYSTWGNSMLWMVLEELNKTE